MIPVPTEEHGWRVEVHDDGDGVPSEMAALVLDDTMGTSARGQTHDGGNGVGLWSVKKMCECVGGDYGFKQSTRLGGAMFWFWVPYQPDTLSVVARTLSEEKRTRVRLNAAEETKIAEATGAKMADFYAAKRLTDAAKRLAEETAASVASVASVASAGTAVGDEGKRHQRSSTMPDVPRDRDSDARRPSSRTRMRSVPYQHSDISTPKPVQQRSPRVSLQVAQEAMVAVTGGVQHPIRTTASVAEIMADKRTVKASVTILVIDDSFIIRVTIKAILEGPGCGYTVELAENGRDGLKAMQGKQFSLVLSDIRMPFKDGFEMTRLLREWEDKCRPSWRQPLVLMSANIAGKEQPRVEAVGANGFLQKPVNLADLAAAVEHHMVEVVDDPGAAGAAGAAGAEWNTPSYTRSTIDTRVKSGAKSNPFETARVDRAPSAVVADGPPCTDCEDAPSTHYCPECSMSFCDGCLGVHATKKRTKGHAVVPVSEAPERVPKLCLSPGGTSGERVRFPSVCAAWFLCSN